MLPSWSQSALSTSGTFQPYPWSYKSRVFQTSKLADICLSHLLYAKQWRPTINQTVNVAACKNLSTYIELCQISVEFAFEVDDWMMFWNIFQITRNCGSARLLTWTAFDFCELVILKISFRKLCILMFNFNFSYNQNFTFTQTHQTQKNQKLRKVHFVLCWKLYCLLQSSSLSYLYCDSDLG